MNLGWFGIDELTYCKEDAWLRLEGRIRHPQARYRRGFAVWTPKGKDWVWRRFISARKIEHYEAVEAKPFENQAVLSAAPDYYTNLKHSYDEKFYRQEVLGEYLDLYSGTVYHAFSSDNVRECTFNPSLPLIVSMDFNVNPMSGVILQVEELLGYATVRVLREIVLPDSHVEPWCKRLIDTVQPWGQILLPQSPAVGNQLLWRCQRRRAQSQLQRKHSLGCGGKLYATGTGVPRPHDVQKAKPRRARPDQCHERNALQGGRPDSPAVYRPVLHRTHHRPRRGEMESRRSRSYLA